MAKAIDLTNNTYGYLRVVGRGENIAGRVRWICTCVCGATKTVSSSDLRKGSTRSCGCAKRQLLSKAMVRHGLSRSRTYHTWARMLNRCRDKARAHYGAEGIGVCARWEVFENFLHDMGHAPKGMSIERIDNTKGYAPENCRWATAAEQNRNRRNSLLVEFGGVVDTLAAHAKAAGLRYDTVYYRIYKRGWPVSVALSTPPFGTRVDVPL